MSTVGIVITAGARDALGAGVAAGAFGRESITAAPNPRPTASTASSSPTKKRGPRCLLGGATEVAGGANDAPGGAPDG